ncbi:MAG: DUF5996 family protein [Betaproteobacteria bacterium]
MSASIETWPELPYARWRDTCMTLRLWTQIVGKIRLVQSPWLNHSWHVPLYVNARGLTTSLIAHGDRAFDLSFDFIDSVLVLRTSEGAERRITLAPQTVADFHHRVMAALDDLAVPVRIDEMPNEIEGAIRFSEDRTHCAYDTAYAQRFWRALLQVDRVLHVFRTGFIGKCSPVHFFWGSFDIAVTRFSGRTAPPHPGGVPHLPDSVAREAYSHEVSSCGFWPGGGGLDEAAFYSYAYPAPDGFAKARVRPAEAYFHETLGEFVLPYDAVRKATDSDATLLAFLTSTYEAAADAARWDRAALECPRGRPGVPRRVS